MERVKSEEGPAEVDQPVILMLPGRFWPLNYMNGEFVINARPILLLENPNSGRGTGWTVWDCSVVLSKYLEYSNAGTQLTGKTVVELGAGPGLAGLTSAFLGARVIITDLAEVVPLIRQNIDANADKITAAGGSALARELDWFKAESQVPEIANLMVENRVSIDIDGSSPANVPDVVLSADVIWIDELIEPLLDTISRLVPPFAVHTIVLLAYQSRSTRADDKLFSLLAYYRFQISPVPYEDMDPHFRARHIGIFRVSRSQFRSPCPSCVHVAECSCTEKSELPASSELR